MRLITRAGNDFSSRFPFIAMAVGKLPVRSCLIDGEAIVCDENGHAVFDLIRGHGSKASAVLCAFDLLEVDGKDLRREPIEKRKALLAKLIRPFPFWERAAGWLFRMVMKVVPDYRVSPARSLPPQ